MLLLTRRLFTALIRILLDFVRYLDFDMKLKRMVFILRRILVYFQDGLFKQPYLYLKSKALPMHPFDKFLLLFVIFFGNLVAFSFVCECSM